MRNLAQYPVTAEEMLQAVDEAIAELPPRGVGDIRPVALQEVRKMIIRNTDDGK